MSLASFSLTPEGEKERERVSRQGFLRRHGIFQRLFIQLQGFNKLRLRPSLDFRAAPAFPNRGAELVQSGALQGTAE